jgi:hypothetical protein
MLTDKVKSDFENWLIETNIFDNKSLFYGMSKIIQYAYIVEYFDSIGWFINIKSKFGHRKKCERFMFHIKNYKSNFSFNSRLEVMQSAIIKTNELLNFNLIKNGKFKR